MSTGVRKKRVSRNTISFWLLSVIFFAYSLVSEEDCRDLQVRAHEIRNVATPCCSGGTARSIRQ